MKTFNGDFNFFLEKIKNKEPFAISRNNDGEMIILNNEFIDLTGKCNGEFIYNPNDPKHSFFRERLLESAIYKGDNYYVGIACRCCVGDEKHEALKKLTTQDDNHLTWGNIFVNGNYRRYVSEIMPLFSEYDVVLVTNVNANTPALPFNKKIVKRFNVGTNAWMTNYDLVDKMKEYVQSEQIIGKMFLIAAGPFSNILIHELYKVAPNNTYLDVGSTLDRMLGLGATRGYLSGADTLNKVCIW
jgi:hypothetical protein